MTLNQTEFPMFLKIAVFALASTIASISIADDKCDSCNKATEATYLVCFKKAKTEAEKKKCDDEKDKQKKVCQLTTCLKKLF
jgi:hypothetical protein